MSTKDIETFKPLILLKTLSHFHQRKQMRVEDALTANRKTFLIYEWFQLVSGQFEKN